MSQVMLLTIEVAMEFWLSLQWTPQAQLLRDANTPCNSLKAEVGALLPECCACMQLLGWISRGPVSVPLCQHLSFVNTYPSQLGRRQLLLQDGYCFLSTLHLAVDRLRHSAAILGKACTF